MSIRTTIWTNPSVRRLAGDDDPFAVITRQAQALAIRAMDEGWSGPPFDPIALALAHLLSQRSERFLVQGWLRMGFPAECASPGSHITFRIDCRSPPQSHSLHNTSGDGHTVSAARTPFWTILANDFAVRSLRPSRIHRRPRLSAPVSRCASASWLATSGFSHQARLT